MHPAPTYPERVVAEGEQVFTKLVHHSVPSIQQGAQYTAAIQYMPGEGTRKKSSTAARNTDCPEVTFTESVTSESCWTYRML